MIWNVVDIESTCWENRKWGQASEIIQVGICEVDTKNWAISKPTSLYIKPEFSDSLSEFCVNLTGITDGILAREGVSRARAFNTLREVFKSDRRPWVSWGDYDRKKLAEESGWIREKSVMSAQHLNLKLLYSLMSGGKPLGMNKALKALNMELIGRHHDGSDDAYNTARILVKLVGKE